MRAGWSAMESLASEASNLTSACTVLLRVGSTFSVIGTLPSVASTRPRMLGHQPRATDMKQPRCPTSDLATRDD